MRSGAEGLAVSLDTKSEVPRLFSGKVALPQVDEEGLEEFRGSQDPSGSVFSFA